jgi:hypothetical protein
VRTVHSFFVPILSTFWKQDFRRMPPKNKTKTEEIQMNYFKHGFASLNSPRVVWLITVIFFATRTLTVIATEIGSCGQIRC